MTNVATTRTPALNATVLARLAERWRSAGVYLACFGRDGGLLWHDAQMPRLMALCVTTDALVAKEVRRLPEALDPQGNFNMSPVKGVHVQLIPVAKRKKVAAWIAMLTRTEAVHAGEDLCRLASCAALDATALAQVGRVPLTPAGQVLPLSALILHMHDDLVLAGNSGNELASVTEQLTVVYEEINLLYKISSGMRFSQKPESFLETVCREVQEIGNFRAVMVAMAHREDEASPPTVGEVAAMVGTCGLRGAELIAALAAPVHESLLLGEAQVRNDLAGDESMAKLRGYFQRFVCVPLMRDKRPLGVLLAIDKNDHAEFNSVDLKLLNNVGDQCSIFMENAALYQDMQGLFMGVLHALTRSIDAKDAYTRGHSQRVAELSRELARKIGLPEEQCERVYLSGLLHDVGKIGVPEAVLTKPGRLTDAEFDAIKKHPAIGAQILGNIKQLQDIIPGVLYHHERWDGRGYPHNVSAENIPLMGRIICVADSFDAMSSTRTYRPALPLETVLSEIVRCAGTQFDPQLAKVFVTLDFSPYRQQLEEQLGGAKPMGGLL